MHEYFIAWIEFPAPFISFIFSKLNPSKDLKISKWSLFNSVSVFHDKITFLFSIVAEKSINSIGSNRGEPTPNGEKEVTGSEVTLYKPLVGPLQAEPFSETHTVLKCFTSQSALEKLVNSLDRFQKGVIVTLDPVGVSSDMCHVLSTLLLVNTKPDVPSFNMLSLTLTLKLSTVELPETSIITGV